MRNPHFAVIGHAWNRFVLFSLIFAAAPGAFYPAELFPFASAQTSALNITTVAGSGGGGGLVAELENARGITAASATVIYVADAASHVVRKVDIGANTVTIVAGKLGMTSVDSTDPNGDGGLATDALLNQPSDVAVDTAGNLYISDSSNHRIRKVNASDKQISTVAGNGIPGSGVGSALSGFLNDPRGLAFDVNGRLLVADRGNNRVAAIVGVGSESPTLVTVAGNSSPSFEGDGGLAVLAALNAPSDVAVDGAMIYIADAGNHKVRVVGANNLINTFAGTGSPGFNTEFGPPATIQLNGPMGVSVDAAHNVYISDTGNHRIRQSNASLLTTIAGKSGQGFSGEGNPATAFTLNAPNGVAFIAAQVFFVDAGNRRLRKVAGMTLSTVVSDGSSGFAGDGGLAINAKLDGPLGVAVDGAGNYYITDTNNHVIRKVNAGDKKISTVAGTPGVASAGPTDPNGDGGQATAATLNKPSAVTVDGAGNLYVADTGNNRIRKITFDGVISTLAGTVGVGAPTLNGPSAVALDGSGNLYIADPGNHVIRRVATNGGPVSIFAGTQGQLGSTGDNGPATSARLNRPSGVAVDGSGNLLIADTNNHRIRKVSATTITSIVAQGLPRSGFEGDGGVATAARVNQPSAVAVDSADNLYLVDKGNNRIRLVTVSDNKINTIIGNGEIGFSGDGGPATSAKLGLANAVAVNNNVVYIADSANNRIRLAVGAPNVKPILTSPGNQTVNEGVTLGFTLQATDSNAGQTLTYTMSGAEAGATINSATGAFSYTPDFSVVANNANATQTFTVTFTATDNGTPPLNDARAITITVNNVNRAPVVDAGIIPAALEATGPTGAPLALNGMATDPDGDTLSSIVWTDTRPSQQPVTIAAQLAATVTLALGQHSLTLTASDGKPNGTTSTSAKNIVVQDTTPPIFTSIPADITQTITAGSSVNVNFTLPTASDVVSGNRTVTANPASGSAFPIGVTTVTFTASDGAGNTATATSKVTVVCNGANCSSGPMSFNIAAFAGNGSFGSAGDGNAALSATFKKPSGAAIDGAGNVYLSDAEARVVRRVNSQGVISLFAGTGAKGFAGDGGAATAAKFNNPTGLAFDAPRNLLFIADTNNRRIRRIDLANHTITTVAGNGGSVLNYPTGLAVDTAGNLYIAETGNNQIRKFSNGQLTVVAGTGAVGNTGDGASATAATLNHPTGVAVTGDGAVIYVADRGNHRVRKISGGAISAFAGDGVSGFGGDGEAATAALLNAPTAVLIDADGNILIADRDNERLRKVNASDGKINTVAGSGNAGNTGDGGAATSAALDTPTALARDSAGVIYFSDAGNLRFRKLTASGPPNNLPVPAAVANQSLNKDQTLDVALSATDADNDQVTFTLTPSPAFVSIINANPAARTATLRIAPGGGNVGVYNVQVQAADGKGGTVLTPSFTITVTDPNPPVNELTIATVSPNSAKRGQTVTVTITGTGFTPQSVVSVNGGGVTVTLTSATSTVLTTKFEISSITSASTRSITVTNPGGASVVMSAAFSIRP